VEVQKVSEMLVQKKKGNEKFSENC